MVVEHSVEFLKSRLSDVKNKEKRKSLVRDLKVRQRKERIARRKQRIADGRPKEIPKTIENMREPDNTEIVEGDEEIVMDEGLDKQSTSAKREIKEDIDNSISDESDDSSSYSPKVLLTCSTEPSCRTRMFCRQLAATIPNCEFRWRRRVSIKRSTKQLAALGYNAFVIVTENREEPNGMLISRIPEGPTARFRLSSVQLAGELHGMSKQQSAKCAPPSKHKKLAAGEQPDPEPQLLTNNFTTRLGLRISTLFSCIFPKTCGDAPPEAVENGRVITFHNQRDFIFFRQHKFFPSSNPARPFRLREVGPRFTLKLRSLQPTSFDVKHGEFEWVLKHHEMETSRRRFFL